MKAVLLLSERHDLGAGAFAEIRIWRVPAPVWGSAHSFKYALALVSGGRCVLRYDNEAGKGDHKHIGRREFPYAFSTPDQLLTDFWADVDGWRQE